MACASCARAACSLSRSDWARHAGSCRDSRKPDTKMCDCSSIAPAKPAPCWRSADMCGIAGILRLDEAPPPAVGEIEAMVGALEHRGPDEFGMYRDERASLGHARLSIIDLKSGQQPLANEDDTLWVV